MSGRKVIAVMPLLMTAGIACAAADERRKAPRQADGKPVTQRQTAAPPQKKPVIKLIKRPASRLPTTLDSKSLGLGCSSGED